MGGSESRKALTRRRARAAVRTWFSDAEIAQELPEQAPDIVAQLCEEIVTSGKSLAELVRTEAIPGLPPISTLYMWRKADPRINAAITGAYQAHAEVNWHSLPGRICDMLDDAVTDERKGAVMAAAKKADLLMRHAQFEVSKRIPAIYGQGLPTAGSGKSLDERIEELKHDGQIVITKVVEVPTKNARPEPTLQSEEDSDESEVMPSLAAIPAKGDA
jgi:hypothetical protein